MRVVEQDEGGFLLLLRVGTIRVPKQFYFLFFFYIYYFSFIYSHPNNL